MIIIRINKGAAKKDVTFGVLLLKATEELKGNLLHLLLAICLWNTFSRYGKESNVFSLLFSHISKLYRKRCCGSQTTSSESLRCWSSIHVYRCEMAGNFEGNLHSRRCYIVSADLGVDVIIVSNHGARQLDSTDEFQRNLFQLIGNFV